MSIAAVLGAGPYGAAIAHALAERARFTDVRIIDEREAVAVGKALDIRQTGPVDGFDTRVTASGDVLSTAGADVVVVADRVDGGEWKGEAALGLVARLLRAGIAAPIVCAGQDAGWLIETAAAELKAAPDRLIGTAASAIVGAVRAIAALEVDGSGADVELAVVGRPGAFVVSWSTATVGGSPALARIPAHRLVAIGDAIGRLWPPGPQSVAAPTARIAEALVFGSRRVHQATALADDATAAAGIGPRGRALLMPLVLGRGRILRREPPALSPQERNRVG